MNKILALNNPQEVDMLLNKPNFFRVTNKGLG